MSGFTVYTTQPVTLSPKEVDQVFRYRLHQLIDGWYIAPSGKDEHPVLCHESEPHPHNGDTFRAVEKELTDPMYGIEIFACRLETEIRRKMEKEKQR